MPDSFISVINELRFWTNEEKFWIKHIWYGWSATFYQCAFPPQGCLPLQCALLPEHSSLLLVSYPLCLLLNGKQRIFGGFLTTYPQQTNDGQEASGLVIILSHRPWLARLVGSQTDKAFVGFLSRMSIRVEVPKVTDMPNLVLVLKRQVVKKRQVEVTISCLPLPRT